MSQTLHIDINESAEELKRMMNEQQRARLRERLQVLYWIKMGLFKTLQELADHVGRSKSVVFNWLKIYRTQGLAGILKWNFVNGGRRSSLPVKIRDELVQRLSDPHWSFVSYREIQSWLRETHGLDRPYSTVHRIVRYELKAKLKVARPFPIQRDEAAVVEFKKNYRR